MEGTNEENSNTELPLETVVHLDDFDGIGPIDMVFGASYVNTLAARMEIALTLQKENKDDKAAAILMDLFEIREQLLGSGHPHVLASLEFLAVSAYKLGQLPKSESIWQYLLELNEEQPIDLESKIVFTNNLAVILSRQGKSGEAEKLLLEINDSDRANSDTYQRFLQTTQTNYESLRQHEEEHVGQEEQSHALARLDLINRSPYHGLPAREEPRQYVVRSFQKSLQDTATSAESCLLVQAKQSAIGSYANGRNTIEVGRPEVEYLIGLEPCPLTQSICSVCWNVNPWRRETAGAFHQRIVAGIPEYRTGRFPGHYLAKSAEETGCFFCMILAKGMRLFSQEFYSSEDAWEARDDLKIVIKGAPGFSSLYVGASKQQRVQFFIDPEQRAPFPAVGHATEIQPTARRALRTVKGIFQTCLTSHPECAGQEPVDLPVRLIKVGPSNSQLKVVETNGAKGTYLTLSYCWGEANGDSKTTSENLPQRLDTLPFDALSKTLQDAVEITRELGYQYLWIDAVCIVQDDRNDWERESVKMANIYRDSILTIAAASGRDAQGGILLDRPPLNSLSGLLDAHYTPHDPTHSTEVNLKLYCRRPLPDHNVWFNCVTTQSYNISAHEMAALPLENRSWCLQERLLSRRIVHFAKDEFFWECKVAKRCECGEVGMRNLGLPTMRDDLAYAVHSNNKASQNYFWMAVVAESHRRGIKYTSDRLPALSGIVERLQEAGFGQYVAGIWRFALFEHILWKVDDFEKAKRAATPNLPTWSWVSIEDSAISFLVDPTQPPGDVLAACENVEDLFATTSPADSGIGKRIGLRAPVAKGKVYLFREISQKYAKGLRVLPFFMAKGLQIRLPGHFDIPCSFEPDYQVLDLNKVEHGSSSDETRPRDDTEDVSLPETPAAETDVLLIAICHTSSTTLENKRQILCIVGRRIDGHSTRDAYERIGVASVQCSENWSEIFEVENPRSIHIV